MERGLQILGALAGTTFFFYLVGGLATWRRFHTLGLSDEASVAALPRSGLLVSGLLAMRHPIVLALLGIVLYQVMALQDARWSHRRRTLVALAAAVCIVAYAAVVQAWDDVLLVAVIAVLSAGAAAIALSDWGTKRRALIASGLLLAIGCAAVAVQYFHLARPPTHLEPAVLVVDRHAEPVVGYFIADTSDFVFIAPRVKPCQVGHVVNAYRREDIAEIHLSRRIKVWPASKGPSREDLAKCVAEERDDGLIQTPP